MPLWLKDVGGARALDGVGWRLCVHGLVGDGVRVSLDCGLVVLCCPSPCNESQGLFLT